MQVIDHILIYHNIQLGLDDHSEAQVQINVFWVLLKALHMQIEESSDNTIFWIKVNLESTVHQRELYTSTPIVNSY